MVFTLFFDKNTNDKRRPCRVCASGAALHHVRQPVAPHSASECRALRYPLYRDELPDAAQQAPSFRPFTYKQKSGGVSDEYTSGAPPQRFTGKPDACRATTAHHISYSGNTARCRPTGIYQILQSFIAAGQHVKALWHDCCNRFFCKYLS